MAAEFDLAREKFRHFLDTEPVVGLLNRNLSFLLNENKAVSSLEVNDGLKCYTAEDKVVIGGADYLMRDDFDARHWAAGLRVLLAHEVQHDNSSDADVLEGLKEFSGRYFNENYGLDVSVGEILGHKLLNILEDARVNNIICQRFPGYISMLRFVCYAKLESMELAGSDLQNFFTAIECFALTGLCFDDYRNSAFEEAKPIIDSAALAETADDCAKLCGRLLANCAGYISGLIRSTVNAAAFFEKLSDSLQYYAFSENNRKEQRGDGSDSKVRQKNANADDERRGTPDDGENADGEKGDSASPGSGDNSQREGDMSGSLSGQEVKPKNSAGTEGREDRGTSSSAGRSTNHGQNSSTGIKNDSESASEKARQEGPNSIREVLGTGHSTRRGASLGADELAAMLRNAQAELLREAKHENRSRVQATKASPLTMQDKSTLGGAYQNVRFSEILVEPMGNHLPAEFSDRAKDLHRRLDKILREQRVRTSSQRKGALSQKDLWKTQVGAKDVFKRKSPPTKKETAFYLLIDRSGSMGMGVGNGNSKLFTALMTAAIIEEALKGIAYTKIVAFDGGIDVAEHCVIKDFEQKEIGNRCIDALTQISAGNGNKDGYSIRVAAMDLEKRSEKRRVLVVLSDGLPSAYYREDEAIGDVRSAVTEARRRGLIVIPVIYGVDTKDSYDAYLKMYEKSIINAASGSILNEFEKLLIKLIR